MNFDGSDIGQLCSFSLNVWFLLKTDIFHLVNCRHFACIQMITIPLNVTVATEITIETLDMWYVQDIHQRVI